MPELLASERGRPYWEAHQHWIVLVTRRPAKGWTILVVLLTLAAFVRPWPMIVPAVLVAAALGFMRVRLWHAERVVLTHKRIIHVHGVLETTREEASLRLDRIAGLRLKETFLGRLWGYANIYVEAPGDHPGLKRLFRVSSAHEFYQRLRNVVFGEAQGQSPDPDEQSGDYITEELPKLSDGHRYRRRDVGH